MEFNNKSKEQLFGELEQHELILKTILDGFILASINGKILKVNPSYCTMVGYSDEELLQMNISELEIKISPEDYECRIEKLVNRGADRFETQHLHKDGRIIDLDASIVIMQTDDDSVVATFVQNITERKLAVNALTESEEQYRFLYESVPVGIGIADLDGNLLNFNDILLIPGGYTREDILEIGNVSKLYADPYQRERVLEILQKQGFVNKHEVDFKRKDGTIYNALISLTPIQLNDEPCIQAVVEDITARKLAEDALRENEERFRTTLEKTGQLSYSFDPETGMVNWAGAIEEVTGYTSEEFRLFNVDEWEKHIHPDDQTRVLKTMEKAIEAKTNFDAEYRFRLKNGTYIHVEEHGAWLPDELGTQYSTVGVINNITERKKAEESLRKSEEYLSNLMESITDAVFTVRMPERRIEYVNHALVEILGYSPEEVIGQTTRMLYPEEADFLSFAQNIQNALNEGFSEFRSEEKLLKKNGDVVWVEIATRFLCTDGELTKVISVVRDISKRKQAERELQEAHDTLEVRVEERTEELQKLVNLMAGREVRMAELKKVIKKLRKQLIHSGMEPLADDPLNLDL